MVNHSPLNADYLGCAGRVTLLHNEASIDYECAPFVTFTERTLPASPAYLRQWTRPGPRRVPEPPQPAERTYLALGGTLAQPLDSVLIDWIITTLRCGSYDQLAGLPGDMVGCLITEGQIFLFRSLFTRNTLFYKQSGATLEWSSDPSDLVPDALNRLDRETIWRICRGDGILAYPGLQLLRPGHLVVFDGATATTVQYDRIEPMELPRRSSLQDYADRAWELLLAAARPYTHSGRIGVWLSGGLDSSAVALALVTTGAEVTAYHMDTDDPLADESAYAREVCRHLDIPFVPIPTDISAGYLSKDWRFSHPYNHTGYRWLEQTIHRVHQDGVVLLTSGRDGDLLFSPILSYGVHDVLFGRLSWPEKSLMLRGLLCSRWRLPSLLKSTGRSYSLVTETEPTGENARHTDFLVPMPDAPYEVPNPEFIPEEQTTDLALAWPHGVQFCSPMANRELYRLMTGMPLAYRCIPFGGRVIDKPVLRLMLKNRLPQMIWRRHGRLWLFSPDQNHCLNHPEAFAALLGPGSMLARMNIVDPQRLTAVLSHPLSIRRNSESLICSAMTELFLRSLENRPSHLVGS
jgi:asparagine synthase (glutamine-hydrolysing)